MDETIEIIKIILLGDSGVGKTCFFSKYSNTEFKDDHLTTIGVDYIMNEVQIDDNTKIPVQIWDTAGQERFRAITKCYIKGANGILLIYDSTDIKSFNNISHWMGQIKALCLLDIQTVLIGNKCDMPNQVVSKKEGENKANEYGIEFFETSALTNKNVNDALKMVTQKAYWEQLKHKKLEIEVKQKIRLRELEIESNHQHNKKACCGKSSNSKASIKE